MRISNNLDYIDFDDKNIICNSFNDSGISLTNNSIVVNKNESKYISSFANGRQISIDYTIIGGEYVQNKIRDKINRIINPLDNNKELTITVGDKIIKGVVDKIPSYRSNNTTKYFTQDNMNIFCFFPYWCDKKINITKVIKWLGDFSFPLSISKNKGITMGHREKSLIANVINSGQVKTGMIIEFYARGDVLNPSLFNIYTREHIKINKDMVAGEKILVNTNLGQKKILSIRNNIETNILNCIDMQNGGDTFLQLSVGDNFFRYNAEENLNNLEVTIYHLNKYLEV